MFKELHALCGSAPIAILVLGEQEKLRVTITQKEGKRGAPIALSILGTPEELDAELPAAITAAATADVEATPVAEQVREQLAAAKPRRAGKTAPKQAAAKPAAPKPAATPKAAKPAKPAAAKPPSVKEKRAALVTQYVALHVKHGDKLTRDIFCKAAESGRSFERLFGGWAKFAKAGKAAAIAAAPNGDDKTQPLPLDDAAAATRAPAQVPPGVSQADRSAIGVAPSVSDDSAGTSISAAGAQDEVSADDPQVLAIAAGTNTDPEKVANDLNGHGPSKPSRPNEWPFPRTKYKPAKPWTCVDESGVYVSTVEGEPAIGATLTLALAEAAYGRAQGEFEVLTLAPTRKTVTVRAVPPPPPPPADWPYPTTPVDVVTGRDKNDTSHGHDVYDSDGNYVSSITSRVEVGGELVLGHGRYVVTSIDGVRVIAAPAVFEETIAAKDFTPTRSVVTMDGRILAGGWEAEVEPGMEFDIPGHGKARVRVANAEKIFVDLVAAEVAAAPPRPARKVIDDEGANLGSYDGDLLEGEIITISGREFLVMGFNAKTVFVEPAQAAEEA